MESKYHRSVKPRPHQQQRRSNATFDIVEGTFDFVAKNGNNVATKSTQIERVQFVSTLSKESFVRLVAFDNVSSTLLPVWTQF